MQRIESAASPVLSPLILNAPRELDHKAQTVAATWAVKTALAFECAYPADERTINPAEYGWMYQHRAPTPRTTVLLAATAEAVPNRLPATMSVAGIRATTRRPASRHVRREEVNAYIAALRLSALILVVTRHPPDALIRPRHRPDIGDRLRQIWPIQTDTIRWPPIGERLTGEDFFLLSGPIFSHHPLPAPPGRFY